jgi:SAM-dependent methyltransferase
MMTAVATQPACEYDTFAPFYDAFTAGSDYEAWATHVLPFARRIGLSGNRLLDVACGTGSSFLPFRRRGFRVTGCDASPAMLAEAARKAPDATLVHADMRRLARLGRFDLVTCFDDSLNHLADERELLAAFRGIRANLATDGVALFDLNTLLAYRTTFAEDRLSAADGTLFAWWGESSPDARPGCHASARLEIFAPTGDLYRRVEVRHRQRHFPRDRVGSLLDEAGLACAGVHGVAGDGSLTPDADELEHLKVLYAARTAKGGDVP